MSDDAWRQGIEDLANGEFWEAHEAWEDLWRELPESSAREATQALIQFAAACYKVRQAEGERREGAMREGMERLLELARGHLERADELGPPRTTWAHELARRGLDRLEDVLAAWRGGGEALGEVAARVEAEAAGLADELETFERGVE